MDRKPSLIIALMVTALITGNYLFFSDEGVVRERVEIERVLDGDTVELTDGRRIRLLNINTPEKGMAYSEMAKAFLSNFTFVELESAGTDRYDRTLGRLYDGNEYLNLKIVREGYAHAYLVSESESPLFSRAEKDAISDGKNIWKKSEYYDCLEIEINKYEEYLDVVDSCDLDLTAWTIKDESTKSYKFDQDFDSHFRIYSKEGWGRDKVWNDDHDEIFIRDSSGLLAYYDSY